MDLDYPYIIPTSDWDTVFKNENDYQYKLVYVIVLTDIIILTSMDILYKYIKTDIKTY